MIIEILGNPTPDQAGVILRNIARMLSTEPEVLPLGEEVLEINLMGYTCQVLRSDYYVVRARKQSGCTLALNRPSWQT